VETEDDESQDSALKKTPKDKPKMVMPPKPKRPPPQPLNAAIVSLAQDPAFPVNFFAGTKDGRILTLQVRVWREQERGGGSREGELARARDLNCLKSSIPDPTPPHNNHMCARTRGNIRCVAKSTECGAR